MISYEHIGTYSVGSMALTLYHSYGWDWDAAYCAAYAFRHGTASTRTPAQALSDMQRSRPVGLTSADERNIAAAYRKVKTGD